MSQCRAFVVAHCWAPNVFASVLVRCCRHQGHEDRVGTEHHMVYQDGRPLLLAEAHGCFIRDDGKPLGARWVLERRP